MKKRICYALCLAVICSLTGCALRESASGRVGSSAASVSDVLNAGMGAAENKEQADEAPKTDGAGSISANPAPSSEAVDVDLTKMSSTMVYSEVYNMMSLPDDYLGKTVRMQGQFQVYEGEGRNYYVVLIADAAACCQQGMEFILAGDPAYPDAYPEPGREVTVTGVFDTYYEGEYMRFCQLIDSYITN